MKWMNCEFVADAIIAQLRDSIYPSCQQAWLLDRRPLIDRLRQKISTSDISWLLHTVLTRDDAAAGLATSLLRKYATLPEVSLSLRGRWSGASPDLKNRLLWRLLDDPNLDTKSVKAIREFVFNEWDLFQEFNRDFYGPPEEALASFLNRISDPSFPETKRWVYFCSAPAVTPDMEIARGLVRVGLLLPDPFCREVCEQILTRLQVPHLRNPRLVETQNAESFGLSFVADAVVQFLRNGQVPSTEDADCLKQPPLVDMMKHRLRDEDT